MSATAIETLPAQDGTDEAPPANHSLMFFLIDAETRRQQEYEAERREYAEILRRETPNPKDGARLLILSRVLELPLEDVKADIRRAEDRRHHKMLVESLEEQAGSLLQSVAELEAKRIEHDGLADIPDRALNRAALAGYVAMIWNTPGLSQAKREKVATDLLRLRGWKLGYAHGWRPLGVVDRFAGIPVKSALERQLQDDFADLGKLDEVLSAASWAIVTGKASPEPTLMDLPAAAPSELAQIQGSVAAPEVEPAPSPGPDDPAVLAELQRIQGSNSDAPASADLQRLADDGAPPTVAA